MPHHCRHRKWHRILTGLGTICVAALLLLVSGCHALCPEHSPSIQTSTGCVAQLDCATRRRLQVVGQRVSRDRAGRLVVRVAWQSVSDDPYTARIRAAFFDRRGTLERTMEWDRQDFRPRAETVLEWTSATSAAKRYLIEVRKDSFFVF